MSEIGRRRFLLAAAALLAPAAARAQPKQAPVLIGWLNAGSRELFAQSFAVFKEELAALGWREGSQIVIEERWTDGRWERLQSLAQELAAKKPLLIVAAPGRAAAAAAKAAPRTPVVTSGPDLIAAGLAKSLARPGGMITGVSNLRSDLAEKYLELLLAAAPMVKRVGFLADPNSFVYRQYMDAVRRSAAQYTVEAHFAEAGKAEEIEPALARLAKLGAQALVLLSTSMFMVERRRIVKLALARRWPVIAGDTYTAEEGALLSYGDDIPARYRRFAYYVDRILRGAKPADLPIEQATRFDMVVNLKTARAMGITFSKAFLARADRVIE